MSSLILIGKLPTLESYVVFGAFLKSGVRYPAPTCHPHTRQEAQAVVKNWIWRRGEESEKDIMWMSGPPGVGKSATIQTVCEVLDVDVKSRSCCGIVFEKRYGPCAFTSRRNILLTFFRYIDASYFFARGMGDQEKAASFPATIAYQLAHGSSSFSRSIKKAIAANPSIFEESWPSQFRQLVLKPATERWLFLGPITIVIDGLDECDNVSDQVQLLELILEAVATKRMRFFIASRPEEQIRSFFSKMHVSQHTCHIRLDGETFQTRREIELFLRAKFARIRQRSGACLPLKNGEDWPGDVVIRQIADESDSLFMYPELAVGFIDLPGFSLDEQLHTLLSLPAGSVFSKIDALYRAILSCRPSSELRRDDNSLVDYRVVMMGILRIITTEPNGPFSPVRIAQILREEVEIVQSIIQGPIRLLCIGVSADPHFPIALRHKSIRDYLLDNRRSRKFFISTDL